MATLNYTTNARRTKAVSLALKDHNAELAARTPPVPAITANQYLEYILDNHLDSLVASRDLKRRQRIISKIMASTEAEQDAILTQLGLSTE